MGYKKDIFGSFVYDFELLQKMIYCYAICYTASAV